MKRPTIVDLARAAGVSVSTVDRVINGRDPVRGDTAEQVLAAAERIGFRASGVIRQRLRDVQREATLGFVLLQKNRQLYARLAVALDTAARECNLITAKARTFHLTKIDPDTVASQIASASKSVDALAVVAANHPAILDALDDVRTSGKPVFALISELGGKSPSGYIGLDNWKVGRMAAWTVANLAKQAGPVGVLVGSHRFRCQELNESGFRSFFREKAPDFEVFDAGMTFEEASIAEELTRELLAKHPKLAGLYIAGGGARGVMKALSEVKTRQSIIAVTNDLTEAVRDALNVGVVSMAISHPQELLARTCVNAMAKAVLAPDVALPREILPFLLQTSENT